MLIIILAGAFFSFRTYIQRGFQGQYRKAGESFGFSRQYAPGASRECLYDGPNSNQAPLVTFWYSAECFKNQVWKQKCETLKPETRNTCIQNVKTACKMGCSAS
jgi:hypothetical protein